MRFLVVFRASLGAKAARLIGLLRSFTMNLTAKTIVKLGERLVKFLAIEGWVFPKSAPLRKRLAAEGKLGMADALRLARDFGLVHPICTDAKEPDL